MRAREQPASFWRENVIAVMMIMMIPLLKCQDCNSGVKPLSGDTKINFKNKSINKLIKIKKNYVQYKQVRNSRELYTICTNVSIIL